MKLIISLLLLFNCTVVYAALASIENIFSQAEKYTLELVSEIKTPFVDDEAGSFSGTGFLIDKKKGWILTNAHVAAKSPATIRGRFIDTGYYNLKKLYVDPVIDLAVVQLDPEKIPDDAHEAELDCESEPRTGHPVGAYGHPWGLSFTAARGIVSGITYLQDDEWLQVDAPVNSGNSGGALISLESGRVVGINTAGIDGAEGLNFALPIKHVCTVVKLLQHGINPSPPELGVSYFQSDVKKQLKIAEVNNHLTAFLPGDVIKSVAGTAINHKYDFINLLRGKKEGKVIIVRNGKNKTITLNLKPAAAIVGSRGIYFSGILITPNNLLDRKANNFSNTWIINFVESGTLAQSYDLVIWDYIMTFDDQVFDDLDRLYDYLKNKKNNNVKLVIKRMSESRERYFDYYEFDVDIKNLKMIEVS